VSLERQVCSCAELQVFSCYKGCKRSMSGDARDFNNIETLAVIKFFFFLSCKARRRRKFRPFWQKHLGASTLVTLPRNVTPYRDSVDGTRDRVTYQKFVTRHVTGLFGALSVFGRHIEGMIRLRPEQVWTCSVTRHHRPLLCPSFYSWCFCLEEWCDSVVLCGFLSILEIVKWSGLTRASQN